MCELMVTNKLFHGDKNNGRGLMKVFTGESATQEQSCDMLTFYQTGEQAFLNYTKYHILQCPSAQKAPLRQHRLVTMTTKAKRKIRRTPKEIEAKQVNKCLRRRLAWLSSNKQLDNKKSSTLSYLEHCQMRLDNHTEETRAHGPIN